jgi:flagellar hook-basal body complex protein FliE
MMEDIRIRGIGLTDPKMETGGLAKTEDASPSFAHTLKESIEKVNHLQMEADHAIQEMAVGHQQNIHQTMIAMEKASVSFQLMMQVRNKIITAYEEMTRMQI